MSSYFKSLFLVFFALLGLHHPSGNAQDARAMVVEMLNASMKGDESKVIELKGRIELLPKPEKGDRNLARTLNMSALNNLRAGNIPAAVYDAASAASYDKSDVESVNNYGYMLLKAAEYGKAESVLVYALTLSPGRTAAWVNLGQVYGAQNSKAKAIAAFDAAYTFSQNKDKTKEFFGKLISDTSSSATLVAAATESSAHEGIKVGSVRSDGMPQRTSAGTHSAPATIPSNARFFVDCAGVTAAASEIMLKVNNSEMAGKMIALGIIYVNAAVAVGLEEGVPEFQVRDASKVIVFDASTRYMSRFAERSDPDFLYERMDRCQEKLKQAFANPKVNSRLTKLNKEADANIRQTGTR